MENKILDYAQVIEKLSRIELNSNIIKRQEPIGFTTYGLPILHFTAGTGKNHIVISAAQHGCEIITTDFVLHVMNEISQKNSNYKFLDSNKHTLHFLPLLNPEGYLIATQAIRRMFGRDVPNDEIQGMYKDYLEDYKKDDNDCRLKLHTSSKRHQEFFGHINQYAILKHKYLRLGENIRRMYENIDIPEGTLQIWHSNGNGVDLNQNTPYNYKVPIMQKGGHEYSVSRYNNIEATKPGPIGCPMKGEEFKYEPENEALLKFLLKLKNNKNINLCAYLNYHSTGGLVYYKPYSNPKEVHNSEVLPHMEIESVYNKEIAETYGKVADYNIVNDTPTLTCFNDLLRLQIPGDILIELSKKTGNPIGPYVEENYQEVMQDNEKALAVVLERIPLMYKLREEFIESKKNKLLGKKDIDEER